MEAQASVKSEGTQMNILEEFYYGNIEVNTQGFDRHSQVGKAMAIIAQREEQLTELLEGKEKKLFLEFCNAWQEVNGSMVVHKFISGFKLGMQFTIEGMKEDWEDDI